MSLIIAVRTNTNVIVGSETLEILVDSDHPDIEKGRNTNRKKILKYAPDFALLFCGTFDGRQMNQFLASMAALVDSTSPLELSSIADAASIIAKQTFTDLKPHHKVGFILAGFNGDHPAIEVISNENDFAVGIPRDPYYVAGHTEIAQPYITQNFEETMSADEAKAVVRKAIGLAKKSDDELGGKTDVKLLHRQKT